jgi:hypothetical protein
MDLNAAWSNRTCNQKIFFDPREYNLTSKKPLFSKQTFPEEPWEERRKDIELNNCHFSFPDLKESREREEKWENLDDKDHNLENMDEHKQICSKKKSEETLVCQYIQNHLENCPKCLWLTEMKKNRNSAQKQMAQFIPLAAINGGGFENSKNKNQNGSRIDDGGFVFFNKSLSSGLDHKDQNVLLFLILGVILFLLIVLLAKKQK